ncbi:conserved membrane protein of unknown function [Tenacibaculum sp. 190130A14a]|uniref:Uncharacterized protein n=1 Tax=Tenacibaculum polynesiense TaxID=3137857 RepID=A0ABM9PDY3_9FLAO
MKKSDLLQSVRNKKNKRIIVIVISLLLYMFSFSQNSIVVNGQGGYKYFSSVSTFLSGAFGVLGGAFHEWLIWLTNPIYFITIYLFTKENKKSKILSLLIVMISLVFTQWKQILINEGGTKASIAYLDVGYWLWVSSFFILSTGIFMYFLKRRVN